jgi:hypothetical protein
MDTDQWTKSHYTPINPRLATTTKKSLWPHVDINAASEPTLSTTGRSRGTSTLPIENGLARLIEQDRLINFQTPPLATEKTPAAILRIENGSINEKPRRSGVKTRSQSVNPNPS